MPKQRTSKSWYVLVGDGTEIKIVGVTTPEAAIEKATEQGHTALSARPMRKFKVQPPPPPPDTADAPPIVEDVDPSTL